MDNVGRLRGIVDDLLDSGYDKTAMPVIRAIAAERPELKSALAALDDEAGRLAEEGESLLPDNPALLALLDEFESVLARDADLVEGAAPELQTGAAGAADNLTMGLSVGDDVGLRASWNRPDPAAVAAAVDYANKPEFGEMLDQYKEGVWDTANNQVIRGIAEGWGPRRTARALRGVIEGLPASAANNLMRTMQLTSYRDAQVVHQMANTHILSYVIRVAVLDSRTCMACVALHGTRLEIGQRVNDHHQGRCGSLGVVRGRERDIRTGVDWFIGLDEKRQRAQMGNAAYDAWQGEMIGLGDFAQNYSDPVWGEMVREASLYQMIGQDARKYYMKG